MSKYLVIIPAHNEEETIEKVVTQALQYADVTVTDDGSTDKTFHILQKIEQKCLQQKSPYQLNIIKHPNATHIPLAIQDGIKYGIQKDYNYFITMDAGLSHDPNALPDFIKEDSSIDVIIGSRQYTKNVPLYRKIISRLASMVVNYASTQSYFNFFGLKIKDCTSGYRRYSLSTARIIASTQLKSKAFDFHIEALTLCVRKNMTVKEIPITYIFSNSSFNRKILFQAVKFGLYLIFSKDG
jgi:dolichol-phosphate mannosyltransferase